MTSKFIPTFSGPVTPSSLKLWLSACEDGFENYEDTHEKKGLAVKTRIRLTGSAMLDPVMAEWWSAGKAEYLALASWDIFVGKIKARFMLTGWKMDALETFYGCVQGKRDFLTFAADLTQSINALPTGTISSTTHKHHLLYFSHHHLYLRMRAIPNFNIDDSSHTPDTLTALMAATWASLVADHSSRAGRSLPLVSATPSAFTVPPTTTSPHPSVRYVPLTEEEKTALTAAGGCWNCRAKPTDDGWIPHVGKTCPGNPAIGARPGRDYRPTATTTSKNIVAFTTVPSNATTSQNDSPYPPYEYPSHSGAMAAAAALVTRPKSPQFEPRDEDTEEDDSD